MNKRIMIFIGMLVIASAIVSGYIFFNKKSHKLLEIKDSNSEYETAKNDTLDVVQEEVKENSNEVSVSPSQDKNEGSRDSSSGQEIKKEEDNKIEEKTTPKSFQISNNLVSWGYEKADGRKIDTVIIHSSYNAVGSDPHSFSDIVYKEYKPYGVSPHYIIAWDGKVSRLVDDKNIAYHAGESEMPDGRKGVNNFSIGVEIINTKTESPSDAQYKSLKDLLAYLKGKYKIKYVLGHKDIAPGRKDDPWKFDFGKIK